MRILIYLKHSVGQGSFWAADFEVFSAY